MNFGEIIKASTFGEIKKCPFCGENEEIYIDKYMHDCKQERYRIFCFGCMAGIDRGYDQKPHSIIEIWNKRS